MSLRVTLIDPTEIPANLGSRRWRTLYQALSKLPYGKALKLEMKNEGEAKLAMSAVHRFKRAHLKGIEFNCTTQRNVVYVERTK